MIDRTADLDHAFASGHVVSAGAWYFAGAARLDALLAEFGYARSGRVHWERVGDDSMSVALVPAYEYLTDATVTVAVVGHEQFRCYEPLRPGAAAGKVAA